MIIYNRHKYRFYADGLKLPANDERIDEALVMARAALIKNKRKK
jgi:hypothetical protein